MGGEVGGGCSGWGVRWVGGEMGGGEVGGR